MANQLMSIYIPRINNNTNEDKLRFMFENNLYFGTVKRIDFTPLYKKPGFKETHDNKYKSAFVHFSYINTSEKWIQDIIDTLERGKSFVFSTSNIIEEEYLVLLKNKNPIQDTLMNNHQIVENCRFLEDKIDAQENKIKELEQKLDGLHKVTTQLIGGLFNQWNQEKVIYSHMNELGLSNINDSGNQKFNNSKWDIWPTTRQGDENENKITNLDKQMKFVMEQLYCLTGEKLEKERKQEEYNKKLNKTIYNSTWISN